MNDRALLLDVSRLIWRRWVGRHPTGIDRVCLAYLKQYGREAQAVVQQRGFRRILDRAHSDALFRLLLEAPQDIKARLVRLLGRGAARSWKTLPGRDRIYLNVGHTGLDDEGFQPWTRAAGVRPVYLLHDLIPITHPEYCRAGEDGRHRSRIKTMLASGTGIIGNSQATLDSLSDFASQQRIELPPVLPALLGSDVPAPHSAARVTPEHPTFVVVGTIEARKNHLFLLQIWSRLVHALGPAAPRLLILGQRGWECEQVFDLLDRSPSVRAAVVEIGACGDHELSQHLRSARALLFPSLVEGFGLPLIEALNAGVPVIASNLPVFEEIGHGVPDYLDPLDGPGWQRAILSYAEDGSSAREAQLQRLAGYRAPTWADHFAKVDRWLSAI